MADDALLGDATVHLREALAHARVSRDALERLAAGLARDSRRS